MPTTNQLRIQLQDAMIEFTRMGLAVATTPAIIRENVDTSTVTWGNVAEDRESAELENAFQLPTASLRQYLAFLKSVSYNCVMRDGSLVQMTYEIRGSEVVRHRLCYYPCPFEWDGGDFESAGDIVETVEMLIDDMVSGGAAGRNRLRLHGPVRFDFDRERQEPLHEASHLHVSGSGCRVPVFGPVSVWQFCRFLVRTFYVEEWKHDGAAQQWPRHHWGSCMLPESESDVFLACKEQL